MSEKISFRRIIVCVDGVSDPLDNTKKSRKRNISTIARLRAVIKTGLCTDLQGRTVQQIVKYYHVGTASRFASKREISIEQQIQDITLEICQALENPEDEIYLYGSGLGAFTVRAVAGVLHHMGVPRSGYLADLPTMFQSSVDLYKARQTENSMVGGQALAYLRERTQGLFNIRFVGVIDTVKPSSTKFLLDTSCNPSIRNFRHALAFNENRPSFNPDIPAVPEAKDMEGRSLIQVWFMGSHNDVIGGTVQDGLSLYPLQWLLAESMLQGVVISSEIRLGEFNITENPLSLAFPQFAGNPPDLYAVDQVRWHLKYSNNVDIIMYDLQSQHGPPQKAEDASHEIAFESMTTLYTTPRKIFSRDNLIGFDKSNQSGTIIHPSVFCLLDRNQAFFEHARFKPYKVQLADFETNYVHAETGLELPWLHSSELLDRSVKAFRILVCGKTGVGKSTLINKVFGVEMTEESTTYKQGDHDINTAFESPNHPGLLIHDSRGWQAGSDQELDLIAQFLRLRAFQKDPAEALHVIWFCVDADVSRIEEADKRTFETIAQYSNHVPVFVVGTKKDKLIAYRKMQLLEEYMEKTNDYQESNRLANIEAEKAANETFLALRDQLAEIKTYKADGFVLISKSDDRGVKDLITQTLDMITDDRVRLFCVAAQVVDVEHKIDSAITECMRLGTHAIRTAMVPLPFSSMIGTPTVSRILCEHVLQCFGFPKAMPDAVEEIMKSIVMGNLKQFMTVTLTQFLAVGVVTTGVAVFTLGIGSIIGIAGSFLAAPPTARMLIKCACDMILILERSFRYSGRYVSVKQIEDAAKQYVSIRTTSFGGKDKRLQEVVHEQVDQLIPLKKMQVGFKFKQLRTGFEHIVYKNRFDRRPEDIEPDPFADKMAELDSVPSRRAELPADTSHRAELPDTSQVPELQDTSPPPFPKVAELPGSIASPSSSTIPSIPYASASGSGSGPGAPSSFSPRSSLFASRTKSTGTTRTLTPSTSIGSSTGTGLSEFSTATTLRDGVKEPERGKSDSSALAPGGGGGLFKKGWRSMSKLGKTKSGES